MASEQAITYAEQIPDIALTVQPEGSLGKYGRARLACLREYKKLLHTHLLTQGTLWSHLLETQQTATTRQKQIITQMMQAQGVTEQLKADNQMLWLGKVNNIYACADEIVYAELIYA